MFGRHWIATKGTVVAVRTKSTTSDGMVSIHEFVVDVRMPSGKEFRARVQEPRIATNFWAPKVGDVVGVEVKDGTEDVRFDKDDPALSARGRMKAIKDASSAGFDAALAQRPGAAVDTGPAAAFPGALAATGLAGMGTGAIPAAQLQQLQALSQAGLLHLDGDDPSTAALREMLLRAAGQADPPV